MVVCLVDYDDASIGLFGWYRTLKGKDVEENAVESARAIGLTLKKSNHDEGMNALNTGSADALLITKHQCQEVADSHGDIRSAYAIIKKLENQLASLGLKVGYETASDAETKLRNGEIDMILATPPIKKSDVINQGLRDEPFPHKVTRHTVPARPLEIDVPLTLLRDGSLTVEKANEEFLRIMHSRKIRQMPSGSVIEGRRYDEEVYLFNKK